MKSRSSRPPVSLVTLNYNGLPFLKKLLESLLKCTYPNLEIIVVDNSSRDESVLFVQENYPAVIIHRNPQNYLYARGNNEGLKIAKGKYICLINNDIEVEAGFIEPIVEAFEKNSRLGACQPKVLSMEHKTQFEYAGACGGYVDWLGYPFMRGRVFYALEEDCGQYDVPAGLFWASGACLFLRRRAVQEVGILDEDFKLHMEEIDLCWRMRLQSWEVACIPQSRVWHHGGATLDQSNPHKLYWNFRNNLFLLVKNLSGWNLVLRLPFRMLLDVLALLRELLQGRFLNMLAIVKAYAWNILHLPLLLKKHLQIQNHRTISDKIILKRMYPGSIVLEYFLFRRRKFSDLWRIKRLQDHIQYDEFGLENVPKKGVEKVYER